jgi:hypothetical protein
MHARLICLALLALTGCASPVIVDYESGTGFAQYETYAFKAPRQDGAESLDGQRVQAAVKPLMQARGLELVDAGQADLLLQHHVKETRRVESTGFAFGFGYGYDHVGVGLGTGPEVREIREGRLVVELADRATNEVVWRAESRHDLSPDLTGEKRRERINQLVRDMFEHFPPAR